jgi:hypothetical protein
MPEVFLRGADKPGGLVVRGVKGRGEIERGEGGRTLKKDLRGPGFSDENRLPSILAAAMMNARACMDKAT